MEECIEAGVWCVNLFELLYKRHTPFLLTRQVSPLQGMPEGGIYTSHLVFAAQRILHVLLTPCAVITAAGHARRDHLCQAPGPALPALTPK